jgi:hypothetical protein
MVRSCQAVRSINSVSYQKAYVLYAKVFLNQNASAKVETFSEFIDLTA